MILVDNGSTDDTVARVGRRFPEVELIGSPTNLGAAGRTLGIDRATTPYVALCDDDTWWEPGSLGLAAEPVRGPLPAGHPSQDAFWWETEDREDPIRGTGPKPPASRAGPSRLPAHGIPRGHIGGSTVGNPGGRRLRIATSSSEVRKSCWLLIWLPGAGRFRYVPELVVHHHPSPHRCVPTRRCHLLRNALLVSLAQASPQQCRPPDDQAGAVRPARRVDDHRPGAGCRGDPLDPPRATRRASVGRTSPPPAGSVPTDLLISTCRVYVRSPGRDLAGPGRLARCSSMSTSKVTGSPTVRSA